jgi:hypothetical protein
MSSASSTQWLLERSLPAFTARQSDDGTWLLAVQLAPADQAALDATAPTLHDLCCQAQHALGLTAIGSRISADRGAVSVYAGSLSGAPLDGPLMLLHGIGTLWFVAHATPTKIRALIHAATQPLREPQQV